MSRMIPGTGPGTCIPGFLLMLTFLWGNAQAALPAVKTVEVNYRELTDEQLFDGVVEAVSRSTVSSQTSGEIVELPYDVNDLVPKDALVLRIDDTRQKAELDKATADAARAQARFEEAQSNYQRNKRLIKDNAVSKSQLDKSEADMKSASAQVKSTAAALEQAREQLAYTTVRAPFDGVNRCRWGANWLPDCRWRSCGSRPRCRPGMRNRSARTRGRGWRFPTGAG